MMTALTRAIRNLWLPWRVEDLARRYRTVIGVLAPAADRSPQIGLGGGLLGSAGAAARRRGHGSSLSLPKVRV
jgi:hypothetical protein